MEDSSCSKLDPGKSVRPMEPWKRVSPTRAVLEGSWMIETLPGECPGVWAMRKVTESRVRVSPWLRYPASDGAVTASPIAAERLSMGSVSQASSTGWR